MEDVNIIIYISELQFYNLRYIFIKNSKFYHYLFVSDNMAVVHIINKQSSTDDSIMRLVRRFVLATLSQLTA